MPPENSTATYIPCQHCIIATICLASHALEGSRIQSTSFIATFYAHVNVNLESVRYQTINGRLN